MNADLHRGIHVKRIVLLFVVAVISLACTEQLSAKHKPNPEAQVAQKRVKERQKELRKLAKTRRNDSKRSKANR